MGTDGISNADVHEAVVLLQDAREQVARQATQVILALTADEAAQPALRAESREPTLLPALLALTSSSDTLAALFALQALVNLAQNQEIAVEMLLHKAVHSALALLQNERDSKKEELLVMLLANLTNSEEGNGQFLNLSRSQGSGWLFLPQRARQRAESSGRDAYEHTGSILTNITRQGSARKALLQGQNNEFLEDIAEQLRSASTVRRRGYSSTLRNCCLMAEEDGTLSNILQQTSALSIFLEAVCGSQGPKEADSRVRASLAEALWLLAQTPSGVKALWSLGAPEKLRKGYEDEEDEAVCEAVEGIAEAFLSQNGQVDEFDDS